MDDVRLELDFVYQVYTPIVISIANRQITSHKIVN